jgi:hypothetical protein
MCLSKSDIGIFLIREQSLIQIHIQEYQYGAIID